MDKIYSRVNWKNEPSTETPVNAENLNKMDSAIDTLDTRVVNLDNNKVAKESGKSLVLNTDIAQITTNKNNIDTLNTSLHQFGEVVLSKNNIVLNNSFATIGSYPISVGDKILCYIKATNNSGSSDAKFLFVNDGALEITDAANVDDFINGKFIEFTSKNGASTLSVYANQNTTFETISIYKHGGLVEDVAQLNDSLAYYGMDNKFDNIWKQGFWNDDHIYVPDKNDWINSMPLKCNKTFKAILISANPLFSNFRVTCLNSSKQFVAIMEFTKADFDNQSQSIVAKLPSGTEYVEYGYANNGFPLSPSTSDAIFRIYVDNPNDELKADLYNHAPTEPVNWREYGDIVSALNGEKGLIPNKGTYTACVVLQGGSPWYLSLSMDGQGYGAGVAIRYDAQQKKIVSIQNNTFNGFDF